MGGRRRPEIVSSAIFGNRSQLIRIGYRRAVAQLTSTRLIGASRDEILAACAATLDDAIDEAEYLAVLKLEPTGRPVDEIRHEVTCSKNSFRPMGRKGRVYKGSEGARIRNCRGHSKGDVKKKIEAELTFCSAIGKAPTLRRQILERLHELDRWECVSRVAHQGSWRRQKIISMDIREERRRILVDLLGVEITNYASLRRWFEGFHRSAAIPPTEMNVVAFAVESYIQGEDVEGLRIDRERLKHGGHRENAFAQKEVVKSVLDKMGTILPKAEDFIEDYIPARSPATRVSPFPNGQAISPPRFLSDGNY